MRFGPLPGIDREITEGSKGPILSLFESRDPKHKYYARTLLSFTEEATHIGIYRKGILFGRKVAKISHYSATHFSGAGTEVILYGDQPVTADEVKSASLEGLRQLSSRLESQYAQGKIW